MMEQKITYTARDGKEFSDAHKCLIHGYKNCMLVNQAFVIRSGFYGQYRGIVKTYDEVVEFIENAKEDGLQFGLVSLGEWGLEKC